eukprot:scaffold517685_cov19-Prasinocladus_malaysianus.AAC.2
MKRSMFSLRQNLCKAMKLNINQNGQNWGGNYCRVRTSRRCSGIPTPRKDSPPEQQTELHSNAALAPEKDQLNTKEGGRITTDTTLLYIGHDTSYSTAHVESLK